MLYVDLDELPGLVESGIVSDRRVSLAALLPTDHLALLPNQECVNTSASPSSLKERVAQIVARETGDLINGPIRLLTQLRYCGYYFSPLNLYYCFDEQDEHPIAVVAEVSNTPWREQHIYVLHKGNRTNDNRFAHSHAKSFHVSPFMEMGFRYDWVLSPPAKKLSVDLSNVKNGENVALFTARLEMTRQPLTRASLARMMIRYPMMTAQVMGAIYFQAWKLWLKKCPYYPHPKTHSTLPQAQTAN